MDTLCLVTTSMAAFRTLIERKPVDREFLISLIDGVVLPAVGLVPGVPARQPGSAR